MCLLVVDLCTTVLCLASSQPPIFLDLFSINGMGSTAIDGVLCLPESPTKKHKQEEEPSWYIFPPSISSYQVDDKVFFRSKSSKELGRRGVVIIPPVGQRVTVRLEGGHEKEVSTRRLLPVFSTECQVWIVTAETTSYRNLASSQLAKDNDTVLEIGCSTGEASAIMVKYCKSWVGLDTSDDMIKLCKSRVSNVDAKAFKVDALEDPVRAMQLVLDGLEGPPRKVFIDIGGNRSCEGVLRMVAWVLEYFSPMMLVIKSRELVNLIQEECPNVGGNGLIANGATWIRKKLHQLSRTIPSHPLQAPMRSVHRDTPICRYHNYHKDGCIRYTSGRCNLDHDHCHLCLQSGHVARLCPLTTR